MESTQGKHVVTDKVAEAVLQCLAELMNKCCLTSVDQVHHSITKEFNPYFHLILDKIMMIG